MSSPLTTTATAATSLVDTADIVLIARPRPFLVRVYFIFAVFVLHAVVLLLGVPVLALLYYNPACFGSDDDTWMKLPRHMHYEGSCDVAHTRWCVCVAVSFAVYIALAMFMSRYNQISWDPQSGSARRALIHPQQQQPQKKQQQQSKNE
jgi:hypothetical protein